MSDDDEIEETILTEEKPRPAHLFGPGNNANPTGRPKGSRNKLGELFVQALQDDFAEHGIAAIQLVRAEKPDQYLKVIASIMPKDLNINVNQMDSMTDDELIERIRSLDNAIRPFLAIEGTGGTDAGTTPQTAH
jgi:hypothetical protein